MSRQCRVWLISFGRPIAILTSFADDSRARRKPESRKPRPHRAAAKPVKVAQTRLASCVSCTQSRRSVRHAVLRAAAHEICFLTVQQPVFPNLPDFQGPCSSHRQAAQRERSAAVVGQRRCCAASAVLHASSQRCFPHTTCPTLFHVASADGNNAQHSTGTHTARQGQQLPGRD